METQIKQPSTTSSIRSRIPPSAGPRFQERRVAANLRHGAPQFSERASRSWPRSISSFVAIAAQPQRRPQPPGRAAPRYRDAVAQRTSRPPARHTVVKAPFAGIVTNVPSIAPGKYLQASMTRLPRRHGHLWATQPERDELTYVRLTGVTGDGRHVPDAEWHGNIESIHPSARRSSRSCRRRTPVENWVKVVQRIPMRVRVDTSDKNLPPLRAGIERRGRVDTGHARGLPHFLTALFGTARRGHDGCGARR